MEIERLSEGFFCVFTLHNWLQRAYWRGFKHTHVQVEVNRYIIYMNSNPRMKFHSNDLIPLGQESFSKFRKLQGSCEVHPLEKNLWRLLVHDLQLHASLSFFHENKRNDKVKEFTFWGELGPLILIIQRSQTIFK